MTHRTPEQVWKPAAGFHHAPAAIATDPGLSPSHGLRRVNRAMPLTLSLPATLEALGSDLETLLAVYWQQHPHGLIHCLLESLRFCGWLRRRAVDVPLPEGALSALRREEAVLQHELARGGVTFP